MIGLYIAVGSANHLPPWGGVEMLLSTNPIAVAIPAMEEPPIVLDMATTVAAYGKVKTAAQRGEQMPEGWMIDRDGKPLTDPTKANEGFLLPIGGYKGYGLALIFGLLAGTLNGAAMGRDVVDFNADDETPTNTGQAILAISLRAFGDPNVIKRQVDEVARTMRSSPLLPGADAIRVPGEVSHGRRLERMEKGLNEGGGPWLMGESLTLADYCIVPTIDRMYDLGLGESWDIYPQVLAWFESIKSRDAYRMTYYRGTRLSEIYDGVSYDTGPNPASVVQNSETE